MSAARLVNLGDGLAARVVPGDGPGDGEAVLWIHGYTLDSSSWTRLWELLPGWRHIGIDLPGHGASLPLPAGDDLPALARRIGGLALRHGVRHVVALSFGTLVALQIAIEHPEDFATVTLAAPALGGGPQDPDVALRYDELADAWRRRGFGPHLRERWMTSPPDLFKGAESKPELWAQLWRLVGRHAWWELGDGSYGRLGNHPQTRPQLQAIRSSFLVLVGDNEMPAFKRCAELIRRSVPDCQRAYVPAVGHLCILEDPEGTHERIARHWSRA